MAVMRNGAEPHVVAVCGSNRDESKTRTALREALSAARTAGATTELIDLREWDLPTFDADNRAVGDSEELRRTIREADALLLGSPTYHGSYSGLLKNALDYCGFDEFEETTVGLLEVAAGDFPGGALRHLREVCRTLRAWTMPHEVAIPSSHSTVTDGEITDEDLRERVQELGKSIVRFAGVATYPEIVCRTPATAD